MVDKAADILTPAAIPLHPLVQSFTALNGTWSSRSQAWTHARPHHKFCTNCGTPLVEKRKEKSTPLGVIHGRPWIDQWRPGPFFEETYWGQTSLVYQLTDDSPNKGMLKKAM